MRAYGRGELVRCVVVDDPSGASIVLPQWMFDPVACAAMRGTSEASVSIAALEDLRRLLLDAHALDTCSPSETPSPMRKQRRPQTVQFNLLHRRPRVPAWSSLPEACREDVVALLVDLLKQHAPTGATKAGNGDDDE